ncbi:uncharacterized protein LOC134818373 [Bolinopsis microptera]|uniref:uncharacterized protein LOC134818373 n=1 Tax=Bolinopsis microptera TaxID=2820187 RepID=UPI00307A57A7
MKQMILFSLFMGLVASEVKLAEREIVMGLPGGIYEGELHSPATREAVKQALGEFKLRALKSGRLGSSDSVIVGDVIDVKTQVVAGQKFIITVRLGLTSDSDCKAKSQDGFVSARVCSDNENLGLHKVEIISQPWMAVKYQFGEFEDVEGPELKSLWVDGAN